MGSFELNFSFYFYPLKSLQIKEDSDINYRSSNNLNYSLSCGLFLQMLTTLRLMMNTKKQMVLSNVFSDIAKILGGHKQINGHQSCAFGYEMSQKENKFKTGTCMHVEQPVLQEYCPRLHPVSLNSIQLLFRLEYAHIC